jgi:hypothetical protein
MHGMEHADINTPILHITMCLQAKAGSKSVPRQSGTRSAEGLAASSAVHDMQAGTMPHQIVVVLLL